jgi:lipoate synthase
VAAIKARCPGTAVEALTPDFQGVLPDVETVVDSGVEVYAQNVETVRRLTHPVRDPRAGYAQTLAVLAHAKQHRPGMLTKTSLMLGLGETDAEILETFDDLRAVGVDLITLGQYLRPTVNHLPVVRFVSAWPGPWCARVTAPSGRSPATTPASTTRDASERAPCAAAALARTRRLRAHLACNAGVHGPARRRQRR